MLLGGTTTFTDMYYFETWWRKWPQRRHARLLGETIIGFPSAKTPPIR